MGLLSVKRNSNFLVTVILSYMIFISLDIIMEIFVGSLLLARVLDIHNITDSLSLFNIWAYSNVIGFPFMILYSLALAILSSLLVFLKYRNKEGVIIESER